MWWETNKSNLKNNQHHCTINKLITSLSIYGSFQSSSWLESNVICHSCVAIPTHKFLNASKINSKTRTYWLEIYRWFMGDEAKSTKASFPKHDLLDLDQVSQEHSRLNADTQCCLLDCSINLADTCLEINGYTCFF